MAAGNTYESIFTQTLSSAVPSITFSSIPSTYTDLVLVWNAKSSATATVYGPTMYFNTDTAKTNYSFTALYGTGSSALSFFWTTSTSAQHGVIAAPMTTSNFNVGIVNINNYSNTTTYKTALSRAGDAGDSTWATIGLWQNTAAINSISLYAPDGTANFTIGSTFSLYGIKAA